MGKQTRQAPGHNTKHDKTSLGAAAHHAYTNHELMVESEVPNVLLAHGSVSPA